MTSPLLFRLQLLLIAFSACFYSIALAFPAKNDLQPFGEQVIANGYARLPGKSSLQYTETYLDDPMQDTIRATYWDNNSELISYKRLNFSDSEVPDYFEAIDYRRQTGYRITVNGNIANVKVIKTTGGREKIRLNKDVAIDDKTIIDAGFHRYVISNWDTLIDGKSLRVKFLQIDKARLVPLKIKRNKCSAQSIVCFKITFDNFLLQGIVPNIDMEYDANTQQLLRYKGIGPVTKMNGKGLPVDIKYEYLQ